MKIIVDLPDDINKFIEYMKNVWEKSSKEKTIIECLDRFIDEQYSTIVRNDNGNVLYAEEKEGDGLNESFEK